MGFHPDTAEKQPGKLKKAAKAVSTVVSAAVDAQRKDPVGAALWPFLMGAELALLCGVRVRWELWLILALLSALKLWSWSIENGHRSPLFMLLARLPKKKKDTK